MPNDGQSTVYMGSQAQRERFAVAKYNGVGTDDPEGWTYQEIADRLGMSRKRVYDYVNNSETAARFQEDMAKVVSSTRRDIVMDLKQRMTKLEEMEVQMAKAVEAQVTALETVEIQAKISSADVSDDITLDVDEENQDAIDVEVPVPARVEEVPQFDKLQKVWEEKAEVQEQLEELLGLAEPDELKLSGDVTERKVLEFGEEVDYPDQEVEAPGDPDESQESAESPDDDALSDEAMSENSETLQEFFEGTIDDE